MLLLSPEEAPIGWNVAASPGSCDLHSDAWQLIHIYDCHSVPGSCEVTKTSCNHPADGGNKNQPPPHPIPAANRNAHNNENLGQEEERRWVGRAAQYACTLLSYALQKNGAGPDFLARIKQLESHLSLGRKLFRLGNSADALEAAKRAIHLSDIVLRFCITVSHLNRAMYFACDNILWAGKSGLVPHMDHEKWSQRSFRYYLFALIMNLSRDAYEIRLLMECEVNAKSHKGSCRNGRSAPGEDHRSHQLAQRLKLQLCLLAQVLRNNPPLLLDVMKNACDIFIPLDKLGMYKTSSGFVGLCGLTSSILSILTILHPWLKLKP